MNYIIKRVLISVVTAAAVTVVAELVKKNLEKVLDADPKKSVKAAKKSAESAVKRVKKKLK